MIGIVVINIIFMIFGFNLYYGIKNCSFYLHVFFGHAEYKNKKRYQLFDHIDEKIKHCCKFVKVKSIKTLILQVKSFNIPSAIFSNSDSKLDVVFIKIKVVF